MSNSFHIETSTLARYRYFDTTDMDEARQRIASVFQPHRLIPSSTKPARSACMNHVRLRHLAFGSLTYGVEMTVEAGEISDYHLIIIILAGIADVNVGDLRASLGKGQGVVLSPATRFGATFSSDCEQFFLRIDKAAFGDHAGLERGRMAPLLELARPDLSPLLAQIHLLTVSPDTVALAQRDDAVAAALERLLVTSLLAGQPLQPAHAGPVLPRSVRLAEAFIAAHAFEPLTLADIAKAAGVPVRTLLHSLHSFRNTTPMQQVRDARIVRSRQLLLQGLAQSKVADIAALCGFKNPGRFARAYKEKFLETPSDTLRAAKQRAELPAGKQPTLKHDV